MKSYLITGTWEAAAYENCSRSMTVHAGECEAKDTGLIDASGGRIFAQWAPVPVGFHLNQWRGEMGCKRKGGRGK